jgi:phosphate transport system permease protein
MSSSESVNAFAGPRTLKRQPTSPRTLTSGVMTVLAFACAAIALVPLVLLLYYVVAQGAMRLGPDLFTQLPPPPSQPGAADFNTGGFGNAFVGTLMTVGLAALFSVPFGILAAIYLSEFARDTWLADGIDFFTNVLSGVPSIVSGVFAYTVVVLVTRSYSAIAAGVALAVLMLPTIVRTSAEALEAVPNDLRQASVGLGATRFQTVMRVVLPAAIPPITTGVMLAVSRAAGETAPVIFTALFNNFWNLDAGKPTATLSVLVFNFAVTPYKNWQQLAWSGALVLVSMVLITSILSRWITRKR